MRFFLGIALSMLISTQASAAGMQCGLKRNFLQNRSTGSLALVRQARSVKDAVFLIGEWCFIEEESEITVNAENIVFAVNNRSGVGGEGNYAVLKVFRRSRATEIRPILALRRTGTWSNNRCRLRISRQELVQSEDRSGAVGDFLRGIGWQSEPIILGICNIRQRWFGEAYGQDMLGLRSISGFIKSTPQRVSESGIDNWSLSVTALSFGTVPFHNSSGPPPLLSVTRDGANELFVQFYTSASKFHQFKVKFSQ